VAPCLQRVSKKARVTFATVFEPVLVSLEVEADELLHRRDEPLAQFRGFDNLDVGAERDQTGRRPLDRLDRDRDADPAVSIRRRRRLDGRPSDE
jgi:hypothetical protein